MRNSETTSEVPPKEIGFTKIQKTLAHRLAKYMGIMCVRETLIEEFHAGKFIKSETGDFSDVKVVTPSGEIPWSEVQRINDTEMKKINQDVLNKLYTFLLYALNDDTLPLEKIGLRYPHKWDAAKIDKRLKGFWDWAKTSEADKELHLQNKKLGW